MTPSSGVYSSSTAITKTHPIRPDIRDAIIQHMDWSRFYEFRAAISGSLCVGWPHRDMRNVFEPAADGKGFKLTDVFEQHLRNPDNWSVAATAAEAFPFLKPVTR